MITTRRLMQLYVAILVCGLIVALIGFVAEIASERRLREAVENGNTADVTALLGHNCAKRATKELFWARSAAMTELLIANGADVNAINGNYSCTAMHFAAGRARHDVVRVLVHNGANTNARDYCGRTPLHWAVGDYSHDAGFKLNDRDLDPQSRLETAYCLLRLGADVDASDDGGSTPLFTACRLNSISLVRCLVDCGADPTRANKDRTTPLHLACWGGGNAEIVRLLIARGAAVNARDREYLTPLQFAGSNVSPEVRLLLGECPENGSGINSRPVVPEKKKP